jgi:hypothetical protein
MRDRGDLDFVFYVTNGLIPIYFIIILALNNPVFGGSRCDPPTTAYRKVGLACSGSLALVVAA